MAEAVMVPIEVDSDELAQAAYDVIQSQFPNWTPAEGNFEAFLIEAISQIVSTLMTVASDVPPAIFRYFGRLVGIVPNDAVAAVVDATFTMVDDAGYLIPANTPVGIRASGDVVVGFATPVDVIVPSGATEARDVPLRAVVEGSSGTSLGALGVERLDSFAFISSITLESTTSGGQDAETDDAYLNRLTTQLRLMAPRPLLPVEYSQFAQTIVGVSTALALNTYDPLTDTWDNEGVLTLALRDATGAAVGGSVRTEVSNLLETDRVLGVRLNLIDPSYTILRIEFEGTARAGWDPTFVRSSAIAAVYAFINSATWGLAEDPGTWIEKDVLRFQDVSHILNSVEGFDYWTDLRLNGGTADITLDGPAALPSSSSTVSGTVTA